MIKINTPSAGEAQMDLAMFTAFLREDKIIRKLI